MSEEDTVGVTSNNMDTSWDSELFRPLYLASEYLGDELFSPLATNSAAHFKNCLNSERLLRRVYELLVV